MASLEYYVRRNTDGTYAVAKFSGGKVPETEYTVTPQRVPYGKLKCDCPASIFGKSKGPCKHIPMVAQFINQGEKVPFCVTREEKQP